LHPLQGTTRTRNNEGPQNLTDAGSAVQAAHHATNTSGTQNPSMTMANLGQGSATGSHNALGGAQNLLGMTQAHNTGSNAPYMQGGHMQGQEGQGWMPGPFFQGYPWTQGQTAPQFPTTPNQWYPQYPGYQPQGSTPPPQPQAQSQLQVH